MDPTRTDWPDWRLDSLGREVERLRKELEDRRKEEWERQRRRFGFVTHAILCVAWALLIANVILAVVVPE